MRFGSLFAGIGGLDLGLERAGDAVRVASRKLMNTPAECSPSTGQTSAVGAMYARFRQSRRRLGGSIWSVAASRARTSAMQEGWRESTASGRGCGQNTPGSSMSYSLDLSSLRTCQPLTIRGIERVLGADLASLGFDAECGCIPAAAVGAPHERWRLFIVAHRQHAFVDILHDERNSQAVFRKAKQRGKSNRVAENNAANADDQGNGGNANSYEHKSGSSSRQENRAPSKSLCDFAPDSASRWAGQRWRNEFAAYCQEQGRLFWPDAQPGVCGVAAGVPNRVDRLRCLGNAVIPQIAEWIGRRIMAATTQVAGGQTTGYSSFVDS